MLSSRDGWGIEEQRGFFVVYAETALTYLRIDFGAQR